MKKLALSILMLACLTIGVDAQRIAIVDINAVLENFTEYKDAEIAINKFASQWEQEVAQEFDKVKSMYNKYQAEQVLLSADQKKEREDEIMRKEKEVRDMQKRLFGPEGELFRKRKDIVAPIQERVFTAIRDYAADKGYDLIFDKGSATGLLFSSEEYDKTDAIKRKLGMR